MTPLPDWLIERAALEEVPRASKHRLAEADAGELAAAIDVVRTDNVRELETYPAGPAVDEIEKRVAKAKRAKARRRAVWVGGASMAAAAAVAFLVLGNGVGHHFGDAGGSENGVGHHFEERVKGEVHLQVFRQVGDQIERLSEDQAVRAGDVLQLRYHGGGEAYGLIASVDGAGVVTLHYPAVEDAPPAATALTAGTATLPTAYALDDAPGFERFFFVTSAQPIDVGASLAALRAFAHRPDSATAAAELPAGQRQWSLRLRKQDSKPRGTP